MKKLSRRVLISLFCIHFVSISLSADDRLKLPRDVKGIEFLFGIGGNYDESAYLGEKAENGLSPIPALMTENFYLDVHQVAYRFHPRKDTILTLIGRQENYPNEDDLPAYLNTKNGEFYDVGLMVEKQFGDYRIESMLSTDVTGTHDGMALEMALGYDYYSEKSHFEITLGTRLQDKKRNNYVYGVSKKESSPRLKTYDAKSDVTAYFHANYTYQLYNNFGLVLSGSIESLSDTAKNSPRIKNDAKYKEVELLAGIIWQFSVYN